jgi:hypothetical protein
VEYLISLRVAEEGLAAVNRTQPPARAVEPVVALLLGMAAAVVVRERPETTPREQLAGREALEVPLKLERMDPTLAVGEQAVLLRELPETVTAFLRR